jgi:predicted AAA+ superfamily ATPase
MKKDILKNIIRDFHSTPCAPLQARLIDLPVGTKKIISLIGPRRSGKTSLALARMNDLIGQGLAREQVLYLNFEDERLDLGQGELDLVLQAYQELYPHLDLADCHLVFDEIQNIQGWDRFIRRLYDNVTKHIIVTGSSARLLSREIATSLRGRTIATEVFPLSFQEYLSFQDITPDINASRSRARIVHELERYLQNGGYPEVVAIDDRIRQQVLQEYFTVMTFRDLVERHSFSNLPALRFFLKRLVASTGSSFSVNAIYNDLKSSGFKVGKNQLYEWLAACQDCFLAFPIRHLKAAVTQRELGEKKMYVIDNGLLNAVTFKFSADVGRLMEQAVFLHLRRRTEEIYFYRDKGECDFIARSGNDACTAIQVCMSLADARTRDREVKGLVEGCRACGYSHGTIITAGETDEFSHEGINISVIPLWRWLLSER